MYRRWLNGWRSIARCITAWRVESKVIHTFSCVVKNNVRLLTEELGVVGFTTLPDVNKYNTILLAVKPQVLPSVLETLKKYLWDCYDSVAAGITLDTLDAAIPQANWFKSYARYTGFYRCGHDGSCWG